MNNTLSIVQEETKVEVFYQFTLDIARKLRNCKLSKNARALFDFLSCIDPFGDRGIEINWKFIKAEFQWNDNEKHKYYRAKAELQKCGLFDFVNQNEIARNLVGSQSEQYIQKGSDKKCNSVTKNVTQLQKTSLSDKKCKSSDKKRHSTDKKCNSSDKKRHNRFLEPSHRADPGIPQTLQTNNTIQTSSYIKETQTISEVVKEEEENKILNSEEKSQGELSRENKILSEEKKEEEDINIIQEEDNSVEAKMKRFKIWQEEQRQARLRKEALLLEEERLEKEDHAKRLASYEEEEKHIPEPNKNASVVSAIHNDDDLDTKVKKALTDTKFVEFCYDQNPDIRNLPVYLKHKNDSAGCATFDLYYVQYAVKMRKEKAESWALIKDGWETFPRLREWAKNCHNAQSYDFIEDEKMGYTRNLRIAFASFMGKLAPYQKNEVRQYGGRAIPRKYRKS